MGALLALTYAGNWTQYGAATPQETADAMFTMYNAIESGGIGTVIGSILPCVTATTPDNCLECDGSPYDGDDYPELYAVIDAAWKGSGTTFFVPDLRGMFPLGIGSGFSMADSGGEEDHTLTIAEMPSHGHDVYVSSNGAPPLIGVSIFNTSLTTKNANAVLPNGGGGAHNNMPPYVAVRMVLVAR